MTLDPPPLPTPLHLGAHVSTAGGLDQAPRNAHKIGATTFGLFVKNPRQWQGPPLTAAQVDAFQAACRELNYDLGRLLPHDGYMINLGHPDRAGLEKSRAAFLDELRRCEALGLRMLNFHPGAHLRRRSEADCLAVIAASINWALDRTAGVTAVIENTAGQGSNLGHRFEHLAAIIDGVEDKQRVGVCLDTCHAYAGGYDLRTADAYAATTEQFDATVGLRYLRAVHVNDAQRPLGSRVDRHAKLGEGEIGWEAFGCLMRDPRLRDVSFILETPNQQGWDEEIRQLRALAAR